MSQELTSGTLCQTCLLPLYKLGERSLPAIVVVDSFVLRKFLDVWKRLHNGSEWYSKDNHNIATLPHHMTVPRHVAPELSSRHSAGRLVDGAAYALPDVFRPLVS